MDRQNELQYNKSLDLFIKRERVYEKNKTKSYAFLWERCSKAMKNKLESRSDYDLEESDAKYADSIFNNPINLLKTIKEHSQNFQEKRYEMSIIKEAFSTMFSVTQKEKESIQDYTR